MTPTLYLLCGLPGSGKTTRAKELEAAGHGVLLSADRWACELYPDDPEVAARDERKGLVESVQWELAERLLSVGTSIVLDWGFWSRSERDERRNRGRDLGADVKTIFLDEPIETLSERLVRRNLDLPPGTFHISDVELDAWVPLFEEPTDEELGED